MNKSATQGDTTDTRTVATNTTAVEQGVTTGRRTLSAHQRTIVAITFFSMFFGAGNLIFPPYVGALAGNASLGAGRGHHSYDRPAVRHSARRLDVL